MKKILLLLLIPLLLSSFSTNITSENNTFTLDFELIECKYGQCKATAKSTGNRCKHCVSNEGDSNCWQHK